MWDIYREYHSTTVCTDNSSYSSLCSDLSVRALCVYPTYVYPTYVYPMRILCVLLVCYVYYIIPCCISAFNCLSLCLQKDTVAAIYVNTGMVSLLVNARLYIQACSNLFPQLSSMWKQGTYCYLCILWGCLHLFTVCIIEIFVG